MSKIAVVLVAGGRGERCLTADRLPKQCVVLADAPIYIWSLRAFLNHKQIDKIVLVVLSELRQEIIRGIKKYLPAYSDRILLTEGGASRQASVLAGLELLAKQTEIPTYVLIHDVVRPFVSQVEIDSLIAELEPGWGCALAVPVTDSLKRAQEKQIAETVNRNGLFQMQTPQAAEFDTLLAAHRQIRDSAIETTDDAAVLEQINVPVRIVIGTARNFKITSPEDLLLAQAFAEHVKDEI